MDPVPQETPLIHDPTVVAIHEASHAVTALASGLPLERVTMTPGYGGDGVGGITSVVVPWQYRPEYALVPLAGRVGTELYVRRPCSIYETGATMDYTSYLWGCGFGRSLAADEDAARDLLKAHWAGVLAVAGALLAAEVLPVEKFYKGRPSYSSPYAHVKEQRHLGGHKARSLFERCGYSFTVKPKPTPPPPLGLMLDDIILPQPKRYELRDWRRP